jgi:hypothetical protein
MFEALACPCALSLRFQSVSRGQHWSGFGALATMRALRRRNVGADITVIYPRVELHDPPSFACRRLAVS